MRRWVWLGIAIIPFVIALVVSQTVYPYQKQLGTTDDAMLLGDFFTVETNDTQTETFRWAQDGSTIGWPSQMLPAVLRLRASPAPNGTEVALKLPSGHLIHFPVSTTGVELRQYAFFIPQQNPVAGISQLEIVTTKAGSMIEDRPINVVVTSLGIAPINAGFQWPPLWPWLVLSLIPLALMALLLELQLPSWSVYGLGLAAGVLLSLQWAREPLWSFTWLGPLLGVLVAAWGLLRWLRWSRHSLHGGELIVAILVVFGAFFAGFQYIKYGDYTSLSASLYWRHWPLWVGLLALALPALTHTTRTRIWSVIIGVLIVYAGFKYANVFARDYADDFKVLFRGPRAFLQGQPLYDIEAIQTNVLSNLYKYPPFFVFVMGPLTDLPFVPAIQTWRALNLLMLVLAALILWRTYGRPARSWSSAGLIAVIAIFQPPYDTLRYGQVDLLLLMVLALALWALVQQRWIIWGGIIALATAIKLYPAYLGIQALVRRRWDGLAGLAGTGILLALGSILLLGWDVHNIYVREVLPISGSGTAWIENQTINGWLARWSTERIALEPLTMTWLRALTYLGVALITGLTWWRARSMRPEAAFGLWIVALLIAIPAAWIHYQAILIIPLYQWLVRLDRPEAQQPWRVMALYGLAWALLAVGNQWTFFDRLYFGPIWAALLSYKLYGLILLWGAIAWDPTAKLAAVEAQATQQPTTRKRLVPSSQS